MNRVTGVMKIHMRDKTMLYLPWVIMSFSFIVNLVIGLLVQEGEGIYTGGVASIYVYMLVAGLVMLPQTFPFALGLSVRRKDYFWGTTAVIALASVAFSFALFLLSVVESSWTDGWGVDLHFFKLPYLNDGTFFEQLWIDFSLLVNLFFLGFAISSVHRRFGKNGMWLFTIIAFVALSVVSFFCTYYEWWGDIFLWLAAHTAFQLSLWMFVLTIIYALAAYFLLRRSTV